MFALPPKTKQDTTRQKELSDEDDSTTRRPQSIHLSDFGLGPELGKQQAVSLNRFADNNTCNNNNIINNNTNNCGSPLNLNASRTRDKVCLELCPVPVSVSRVPCPTLIGLSLGLPFKLRAQQVLSLGLSSARAHYAKTLQKTYRRQHD